MTKNVLLIGPYRQNCSWGKACKSYIRAIHRAGINLTLRPIYMGTSIDNNIDPFFLKLEKQKFDKYDAIIQNVLPHLLDYNSRFGKNIALFYTETGYWTNTWPRKINRMDEIWTPSFADVRNIRTSGIEKVPIKTIPIPLDCDKFFQNYDCIENIPRDTFKFYFVGEVIERKNIDVLIRAFHTEFERGEPVDLVLKVNKQGLDYNELSNFMSNIVNSIKKELRIYGNIRDYKQEIVIPDYLPEEVLLRLHYSCDCFVMPSSGESWCMPVADALGLGKPCIVTKNIGPEDMIPTEYYDNLTIDSHQEAVITDSSPLEDLYTGSERWYKPSQINLQQKMRNIFNMYNTQEYKQMSDVCAENILQYSEKAVSKLIGETI